MCSLTYFASQTKLVVIRTFHESTPQASSRVLPSVCDGDHTLIDCL